MNEESVNVAASIAQSEVAFGILFIVLLIAVLWFGKMLLEKTRRDNADLIEKVDSLHTQRQEHLMKLMDDSKTESKERESKLMEQISRSNDSLESINLTQVEIQRSLGGVQNNIIRLDQELIYIKNKIEK